MSKYFMIISAAEKSIDSVIDQSKCVVMESHMAVSYVRTETHDDARRASDARLDSDESI